MSSPVIYITAAIGGALALFVLQKYVLTYRPVGAKIPLVRIGKGTLTEIIMEARSKV